MPDGCPECDSQVLFPMTDWTCPFCGYEMDESEWFDDE